MPEVQEATDADSDDCTEIKKEKVQNMTEALEEVTESDIEHKVDATSDTDGGSKAAETEAQRNGHSDKKLEDNDDPVLIETDTEKAPQVYYNSPHYFYMCKRYNK
jgi:hypothetical protein